MFAMALVAITVGCTKSEQGVVDPNSKNPINISTTITRATDTEFEAGDKIGLYVVNYNGSAHALTADANHVNNMDFTYSTDPKAWTPGEEVFWRDMVPNADFYAYYPHIADITNVNALPWEVKAVQSDANDYWAGDFMWTKETKVTPTTQAVTLNMKHILSHATVTLVGGTGFEEDPNLESAEVELFFYGVKTAATIDLATGAVTATGNATVVSPWKTEVTTTTGEGDEAVTVTKDIYRAMIIPQTIEAGKTLISVSVNGVVYPLVVENGFTFEPGKKHNFTVTVNATKVNLTVEITDWEDVNLDNKDIAPTTNSKSAVIPSRKGEAEFSIEEPSDLIWKAMTDADIYGSYWGGTAPTAAFDADYKDSGMQYVDGSFKQARSAAASQDNSGNMVYSDMWRIWDNYISPDSGHNNVNTYMNSAWTSSDDTKYPYAIFIDLGSVVQIDALRLFCRGGRADNNAPGEIELWVSDDSTPANGILDGWVKACEHDTRVSTDWATNYVIPYVDGYEVTFPRTKPCRYVRFVVKSDRKSATSSSIAEMKLYGVQHKF